ncbi:glycosyltransferase family 9 protein [Pseudonocardia zijingensis]|uniref:glycosyltransferase family 9 protein n=1 Tax=Pseudonocardia zijingensis TaxID=153376 RepID=UPI0036125C42
MALTGAGPRPGHHPGADRGPRIDPDALRRVLLVRADNLGDTVMVTAALHALRTRLPRARIDLLLSPAGAAAAPMLADVDAVFPISATWQQLGPPPTHAAPQDRELVAHLRHRCYDAMIVCTSFSQSPWPVAQLGLLAGIPVRVVQSREFGGAAATHWVTPPPEGTHQVDRDLHLLAAVGLADPAAPARTRLAVPPAAHEAAAALAPERYALLAPGASCPARRYRADRFAQVAAAVAGAGLPVRVSGSRAEQDLVAEVVAAAGPGVAAVPPVGVPEFAALVARAAVAITNNSAGMHVADATGTPVVVTHGGTERLTDMAPRGVPAVLLRVPTSCSPCRQLQCPYSHECLDLPPARVAEAAVALAEAGAGLPEDPWWTENSLVNTVTTSPVPAA